MDAFYPVVDTEIGRLGIMMANEGSYPENARGLAMNGAEIVYRASFPHRASDAFEVQTRARALDNNMYVIAPNLGTYYLTVDSETPIDTFGGGSLIADHQGRVIGSLSYSGASSWVAGTIDVEALRKFRANSRWGNWMKDLTTEQYRLIYDQPVYPKNLYLDRAPYTHDEYRERGARAADPSVAGARGVRGAGRGRGRRRTAAIREMGSRGGWGTKVAMTGLSFPTPLAAIALPRCCRSIRRSAALPSVTTARPATPGTAPPRRPRTPPPPRRRPSATTGTAAVQPSEPRSRT